jgi:hypothetical protein
VEATQSEDGALDISVPPLEQNSSLFSLSREDVRRFYQLCTESGSLALKLNVASVGEDVEFRVFDADAIQLPEDAAEFEFMVRLGNEIAKNTAIGTP